MKIATLYSPILPMKTAAVVVEEMFFNDKNYSGIADGSEGFGCLPSKHIRCFKI